MAYTNDQIQQIVDWFFTQGTRQYIGSRYVPIFADPIQHSSTRTYEPLTIVQHQGNSYTSKQYVPTGIAVTDTRYWALTGNYNAQVEQYRQEVLGFDSRINDIADNIEEIQNILPIDNFSSQHTVQDEIDDPGIWLLIGDSWSDFNEAGRVDWSIEANKGFNYTKINYAKGGTGFTSHATAPTFDTRLQLAISELSTEQKKKVKKITIIGGVNDIRNGATYAEMKTAASTIVMHANNAFPNAVVYLGYNVPAIDYGNNVAINCFKIINKLKDDATFFEYPCVFLNTHFASLTHADSELYASDLLHLDTAGGRVYSTIVHSAFSGTTWMPTRHESIPSISNGTFQLYNTETLQITNGCVEQSLLLKNISAETIAPGTYTFDLKSLNNLAYKWLQAFNVSNIYILIWKTTGVIGWMNIRPGNNTLQFGLNESISPNGYAYLEKTSVQLA